MQGKKRKKKVEFTLPWPPSVNAMYKPCQRTKRCHCKYTGKVYYTKYLTEELADETKDYYDDCGWLLKEQFNCKVPKFYKKVTMLIEFFPRRDSGWDENNFKKAPEDAIVKAGMIPDDQVKFLKPLESIIHKRVKLEEQPYIKITLEEI